MPRSVLSSPLTAESLRQDLLEAPQASPTVSIRVLTVNPGWTEVAYGLSMQRRILLPSQHLQELRHGELPSILLTHLVEVAQSSFSQLESREWYIGSSIEIDLALNYWKVLESRRKRTNQPWKPTR